MRIYNPNPETIGLDWPLLVEADPTLTCKHYMTSEPFNHTSVIRFDQSRQSPYQAGPITKETGQVKRITPAQSGLTLGLGQRNLTRSVKRVSIAGQWGWKRHTLLTSTKCVYSASEDSMFDNHLHLHPFSGHNHVVQNALWLLCQFTPTRLI